MFSNIPVLTDGERRTAEKRRLIGAMDDESLLGLSKLGDDTERHMARVELDIRAAGVTRLPLTPPTVLGASARLVAACDRLDALSPPASLVIDVLGSEARFERATGESRR